MHPQDPFPATLGTMYWVSLISSQVKFSHSHFRDTLEGLFIISTTILQTQWNGRQTSAWPQPALTRPAKALFQPLTLHPSTFPLFGRTSHLPPSRVPSATKRSLAHDRRFCRRRCSLGATLPCPVHVKDLDWQNVHACCQNTSHRGRKCLQRVLRTVVLQLDSPQVQIISKRLTQKRLTSNILTHHWR